MSEIDAEAMQEILDNMGRLAAVHAHYFEQLLAVGFTREEALTIVISERTAQVQS